uniref:Uncharacterized protein n=1 Tax=Candidatus Methanogaster sp. ANME-2c ERB4 TaxID=2759911 RepID=A0A7G9YPN1_9EURY|nr:hypothetical protein DBPBNLAN_00036 [Methanosarcinales archaeon ANME-2c ERB4]QNO49965.1 hypothetical protein FNHNGOKL_00033 [Methanosarcinales archaeon ANME-2c ERB4]
MMNRRSGSGCAALLMLALVLAHPAAGFAQYASPNDVTIPKYLIELNYETSENATMWAAYETIVFRNGGGVNRSEEVRITVPENAEIMQVTKEGHATDAASAGVAYEREGEVIGWNMTLKPGGMAMYSVRYVVPLGGAGTPGEPDEFVKKLIDPAIMNYPIASLILKVNTDTDIEFTDGSGNTLKPDSAIPEDDGGVRYTWDQVTFGVLHVILPQPSQSQPIDRWIAYAVIALLLISALLYPVLHVKNNKLRGKDGALSCSGCSVCDKGGDGAEEEPNAGGDWEEMDEIVIEITQSKEDLIRKKKAILAVLSKLDEDHDAGEVSDDDYRRLTLNYKDKAIEIVKQLDKME